MNIFAAVALVAILIFIHELGHYVVAKACGVQVRVFSLGYGRRIVGFERGGTDYRISLLPFGGYVLMAGADPFGYGDEDDAELEDPRRSFMRRPVWQRLLVVAAGPAFNLALPLVVFTTLFMAGEPQPAPVLGEVEAGLPAAEAGLQAGDEVISLAGTPVATWMGMQAVLKDLPPGSHPVVVERDGQEKTFTLNIGEDGVIGVAHLRVGTVVGVDDPASPAGRAGLQTGDVLVSVGGAEVEDWIGVERAAAAASGALPVVVERGEEELELSLARDPAWAPRGPALAGSPAAQWGLLPATLFVAEVGEKVEDAGIAVLSGCRPGPAPPPSPALQMGIQPGDRFYSLDGKPVTAWNDVLDAVRGTMVGEGEEATARSLKVELIRAGQLLSLEVTPQVIRDTDAGGRYYYRAVLGTARAGEYVEGPLTRQYYGFPAAARRAGEETLLISKLILQQLGKLVTGEAAVDKSLGGPVEIVRQASYAAEKGLFTWARLLAMLSISLGIINLVPVPVLDGGQLLFYAVEGIRGRPLSHALRERAQQIGVLFLVMLMLAVLVFDIHRLFEG